MCDPVSIGLMVASAAVTAGGQVMSGIGQSNQYKYQASIDKQNASIANGQARDAIENTNLESQRRYREASRVQGQQQAAMAANGVSLDFGSAVDVQRDSKMIAAEDITQIYKAGNEKTKGFEINAFNYRSSAAANNEKAKGAMTAAIFGAASTALGAASQMTGMKKPSGGGGGAYGISGSDGIY